MKKSFSVLINGQKAVDAGYTFCGGYCYRHIMVHGKSVGQLEVVLDSDADDGLLDGIDEIAVYDDSGELVLLEGDAFVAWRDATRAESRLHPQKLVVISGIRTGKDVERVLSFLSKAGFSGCFCEINETTISECYEEDDPICGCFI